MDIRFEAFIEKLRALPDDRQSKLIDIFEPLISQPVDLSDEELAVLLPALEAVKGGDVASEEEVRAILDQPWG